MNVEINDFFILIIILYKLEKLEIGIAVPRQGVSNLFSSSPRREAPKGGGWGRGSPPPAGGGSGGLPREIF